MRIAVAARAPLAGGRLVRSMRSLVPQRVLVLGAVVVGLASFQVWLQLQVRAVAYHRSSLAGLLEDLTRTERDLQIKLAGDLEPLTIKTRAKKRLGMVEPKPEQVVDVP